MSKLRPEQDAFGAAMYDCLRGHSGWEIVERDDGYISSSAGPEAYFKQYEDWSERQRKAIALARGRVLDIGCGAGRVLLHLQGRGLAAVGIDVSPLAVKVCRLRRARQVLRMSLTQLSRRLGVFDTVVMFGANFGLVGNPRRARWVLRRLHAMTSDDARILAEGHDPYPRPGAPRRPGDRQHLAYHAANRAAGRMSGQVRIRIRYQRYATPYFEWLLLSREELRRIVVGTGWRVARIIESKPPGSVYVAVLEKQESAG